MGQFGVAFHDQSDVEHSIAAGGDNSLVPRSVIREEKPWCKLF
jgi:hypothetical protein